MKPDARCIVFLINSLSIGGAERVFISQANDLFDRGWDVHFIMLFSPGPLAKELRIPMNQIVPLDCSSVFDLSGIIKLVRYLRSVRADTLYSTLNEANAFGRFARIICWRVRLFTREANMADIKPMLYKLIDVLLGSFSYCIIAVSFAVAESIWSYAPWLRSRTKVLYNGVRVAPMVAAQGTPADIHLLTVGSLTEKKDQMILIEAMSLLPVAFSLTIVGDGVMRHELELRALELGISNRVQFTGILSRAKLSKLYQTHHVFVLPSRREGCPNVVAEAQSFALPVVAFDIPGMREFVTEKSGAIVSKRDQSYLASAIKNVSTDLEHARELGREGLSLALETREYSKQMDKLVALLVR